jgi:subtilisin family serine protease
MNKKYTYQDGRITCLPAFGGHMVSESTAAAHPVASALLPTLRMHNAVKPRVRRTPALQSFRSFVSLVAGSALVATGVLAAPLTSTAAPLETTTAITAFDDGRYIVVLADDAVATYEGDIPGLPRTAPKKGEQLDAKRSAVAEYRKYLKQKQKEAAALVGADIVVSYTTAINGFAADLTAVQAAKLAADRSVLAIARDELLKITSVPGTEFLGLEGPGGVWEQIGGADRAGRGVVIGVLDTGIAPENPSFAGEPLGTTAGDAPYRSGDSIVFAKSDGTTFTGVCEVGAQFTVNDCSTKIVGARYFVAGFGADRIGDASTGPGEFLSPRDGDGHGSHTAGTAAGNHLVGANVSGIDFGQISGVAPGAKIASYKVCWNGKNASSSADDGCATSDLLAGIDAATSDGVDVINYSIGGGAATTTVSITGQAFLGAAAAGIFVSASAGNSGPGSSTLDNASPWVTTVAASTIPSYEATATLGSGESFAGASITVDMTEGAEALTGSLVLSDGLGAAGATAADVKLCAPNSLDASAVPEGAIVVCDRGVYDRVSKSAEVKRVGGIGMIMVNVGPGSVDADAHSLPSIHLNGQYRDAVRAHAATEGATASLAFGNSTNVVTAVPQVAGFSSRGPVLADGSDILKPDISAPGVGILAATSNRSGAAPTFNFLSGTSMSAPHIAGLALLYLGERPKATPAEVKSALMTSAYDTKKVDGSPLTDPFTQGAGHADPTRFFEPGLLYLNGLADWYSYIAGIGYDLGDSISPVDASDLNLASLTVGEMTAPQTLTRTVTATQAGTFTASVQGMAGMNVAVEPSTLSFTAPGEIATFRVTFTRTTAPLDAYATGSLTWSSGATTVRSPLAARPVTIIAAPEVAGVGTQGSVEVSVTPGGTGEIALATTGLSRGERLADPDDAQSENSGSGTTGFTGEYVIDVPEGAVLTRFDLDSLDDTADLDLIVYRLNAAGQPVALWYSATGSADERVDIVAPQAGQYLVLADVYSASGTVSWNLTVTSVVEGGAELALDPAVLAGQQGVESTYAASWSGLEAQSTYLGLVRYRQTGATTIVTVETGAAPFVSLIAPQILGVVAADSTVTATGGTWNREGVTLSYQWMLNGEPIAKETTSSLKLKKAWVGASLTVVVTATTASGETASAASEPTTVVAKPKR